MKDEIKETADLCSKHFVKIQVLKEELKSANESITWWQNRFNAIQEENERLNNIIKEVREYVENHSITNMEWWITGEQKIECKFMKDANPQELLEILDKAGDEK